MLEQASGSIDQMARLAMVCHALTETLHPSEIIDIAVRQGMAGLGAEGGVLALVARDGAVVPVETVGYPNDAVAAFPHMSLEDDLPITVAARNREPVWVASRGDAQRRFPSLLASAVSRSQAWAAIPIVADGSLIGCLGVSFLEPRDFTEPERLFIRALGDQCALALALAYRTGRGEARATDSQAPSVHTARTVRSAGALMEERVPTRDEIRRTLAAAADVLFSDGVPAEFLDQWADETGFMLSVYGSPR